MLTFGSEDGKVAAARDRLKNLLATHLPSAKDVGTELS
jgi:hypothetical protein